MLILGGTGLHVLAVKNDAFQAALLTEDLRGHGCDVVFADSGKGALKPHSDTGLVLLDLDLSDVDGSPVRWRISEVSDTCDELAR